MSKKDDIKADEAAKTCQGPQKEESKLDKIRKLEDVISENEELKMATTVLCEIRDDVRKKQIFLQMSAEIEDLKKKLTKVWIL